jgi:hypothetical protein
MKLLYFILATTFFLFLGSCTENDESLLPVYDLVGLSDPETVLLSSVCDDIEYVPLETGDTIIGNISDFRYSAGRYAVQSGGSISVFDNTGKLLYILDKQGRGPGEYSYSSVFDINGTGEILVYDSAKDRLLFYNTTGKVIRELKNLDGTSGMRLFGDDKIFLTGPIYNGTNKISEAMINLKGDTLMAIPNKFLFEPSILVMFRFECVTYTRNDKLYYHEVMDDTVYCVDKNLETRPHVVLNTGEDRFTTEKRSNVSFTEPPDAIYISKIIETDNYFFVDCSGREYLVDKNNVETKVVKDEGLLNDIDGGMHFSPDLLVDDKYLVQIVDAFKFNLWLESEHFKSFIDKLDKKDEFRELAERLTENDNPVLVRCRVK